MSIDERDYYNDPKRYRNSPTTNVNHNAFDEDAYWRQKAVAQREQIRNWIILGAGLVALVWLFGSELSRFWKSLPLPSSPNEKVVGNTPPIIPPRPTAPVQQFPESGAIIQYHLPSGTPARFTVISGQDRNDNCVVKLETWREGTPTLEIFVRAGETAETRAVPLGDYRVKYACGIRWYGRSEMFGEGTVVSIGETPLQFWQSGNKINGNILTLEKRVDGNFRTKESYFNKF
jgi:hypothetical protein